MTRRSKRSRGGPALADGEDGGAPIVPRVIYTKDWLDPRLWVRPGEHSDASSGTPSRAAMWFIYAVFIAVAALCALAIILPALGK